jgi:type IV pilus assembly protein PilP
VVLLVCSLGLVACAGDQDELQQWMEQQKREVKPNVEPLSAPKKFNPQPYAALGAVEPFSTQKLSVALKQEARQPNSLPGGRDQPPQGAARGLSRGQHGHGGKRQPEWTSVRTAEGRQPPLSSEAGRLPRAELRKITKISETDVSYREIVQDAAGEWIERNSALQLQEKAR